MGTYTWVRTSTSEAGAITTGTHMTLTLTIPAGSILKKYLIYGNSLQARNSAAGFDSIAPLQATQKITIGSTRIGARQIFYSVRRIPFEAVAIYDVATLERVYTQYFNAGDDELGVDEKCSYGRETDTSDLIIEYENALENYNALGTVGVGIYSRQFAALYYTPG